MSGDPEQEYFSDGISEDIITDLSKVSALAVVSRNTAFTFKGKNVDLPQVARQLKVSYVLEGSVRRAGGRVRITAQLIEAASDNHVWAERYDRDLNDIFALQDEISEAIVTALKLKLLPEEKKAIEQRGTNNLDAYNLYLMARHHYTSGMLSDVRKNDTVIRLCRGAIELDAELRAGLGAAGDDAALSTGNLREKATMAMPRPRGPLELDANLAEAHPPRPVCWLRMASTPRPRRKSGRRCGSIRIRSTCCAKPGASLHAAPATRGSGRHWEKAVCARRHRTMQSAVC